MATYATAGGGGGGYGGGYSPTTYGGGSADIYGRRPDPVVLADPAQDLSRVYPNLPGTNAVLSDEILRMIMGSDPNLPILAQNTGAARGAQLGLSGSQFAGRMGDLSLYDRRNQQRQAGIQAYNQTIPTVSATQTNSPALQQANQTQNNIWASAPDPAAAAQQALSLYQSQLKQFSGGYSTPQISRPTSQIGNTGGFGAAPASVTGYQQPQVYSGTNTGATPSPYMPAGGGFSPQGQQQPAMDPVENAWWDLFQNGEQGNQAPQQLDEEWFLDNFG
jgi:hypothetical protein